MKGHTTRQKLTFRIATRKPRNPLALRARQRSAGPHRKSASALRGAAKRELKKIVEGE
jgi:hypothetical protein